MEEREYFVEGVQVNEALDANEFAAEGVQISETVESEVGGGFQPVWAMGATQVAGVAV